MKRSDLVNAFLQSGIIPSSTVAQLGANQPAVVGDAMDSAILEFASDSPRLVEKTGTWTGVEIDLSAWISGVSALRSCEHPTGQRPRAFLRPDDRDLDVETGGLFLLAGQEGSEYLVRYTSKHTLPVDGSEDESTLEAADLPPFYQLTLAYLFEKVATYHAESIQSGIGADSVSHTTKTDTYLKLKDNARSLYRTMLRLPEKKTSASFGAAVVVLRAPNTRHFPDMR